MLHCDTCQTCRVASELQAFSVFSLFFPSRSSPRPRPQRPRRRSGCGRKSCWQNCAGTRHRPSLCIFFSWRGRAPKTTLNFLCPPFFPLSSSSHLAASPHNPSGPAADRLCQEPPAHRSLPAVAAREVSGGAPPAAGAGGAGGSAGPPAAAAAGERGPAAARRSGGLRGRGRRRRPLRAAGEPLGAACRFGSCARPGRGAGRRRP